MMEKPTTVTVQGEALDLYRTPNRPHNRNNKIEDEAA